MGGQVQESSAVGKQEGWACISSEKERCVTSCLLVNIGVWLTIRNRKEDALLPCCVIALASAIVLHRRGPIVFPDRIDKDPIFFFLPVHHRS